MTAEKQVKSIDVSNYDTMFVNGRKISRYDNLALHCAGLKISKTFESPFSYEGVIVRISAIEKSVTVKLYDGRVDRNTVYTINNNQ